jgi:AraC-like DNA-binding protein
MIDLRHDRTRFPTDHHGPVPAGVSSNGQNGGRTYDRRLLLVLMLVEENMRRQLVIRDLAEAVNLSSGRLAHLFKSEIGVSPQRYINIVRMAKAKQLLEEELLSMKEIAAEVGIANASRFCRSFKALYGTTPKEYRKTHLRLDLKSIGVFVISV